jgi:hypothetical protein
MRYTVCGLLIKFVHAETIVHERNRAEEPDRMDGLEVVKNVN